MSGEMERPDSNPNMVVPGTGHVSASYADQQAAGINYTDNAHMVHFKLAQHQAQQRLDQMNSWNKPAPTAATKPMQYRGPSDAGMRRTVSYEGDGMPMPVHTPKTKGRQIPLARVLRPVIKFSFWNLSGIIFFALLMASHDIYSILQHTIGTRLTTVLGFGALFVNAAWLIFKLGCASEKAVH